MIVKTTLTKPIKTNPYNDRLEISVPWDVAQRVMDLQNSTKKPLDIEIKIHREMRSLSANNYMWKLCTQISEVLSDEHPISKEAVYQKAVHEGNCFIARHIKDEKLNGHIRRHNSNGLGWFVDIMGKSNRYEGYTYVYDYYGSSSYDTKEMHDLISRLEVDAKEQGIKIVSREEYYKMIGDWDREVKTRENATRAIAKSKTGKYTKNEKN